MLEQVDFSQKSLSKQEYKPVHDELMQRLVLLQQQAHERGVGLVVVFEGWNGAGKGGRISDLLYQMDARATGVYVTPNYQMADAKLFRKKHYGATDYYPLMQQFWGALGPRGNMTLFDRAWYTANMQWVLYTDPDVSLKHLGAEGGRGDEKVQAVLGQIADFERQLADDGYVVVKFFLHISEKTQKKRLSQLASDPSTAWRVQAEEMKHLGDYDAVYPLFDRMLSRTDFDYAPWTIVNAEDKRSANLVVAQTMVTALEDALKTADDPAAQAARAKAQANSAGDVVEQGDERTRTFEQQAAVTKQAQAQAEEQAAHAPAFSRFAIVEHPPTLLEADHTLSLPREQYRKRLKKAQKRLFELELQMYLQRIPMIVMYEGWDAAGKGGNIKRVAQALDARSYTIFPSPAPTKPELLHPHLWRYWTRLPKAGHVGIYDRSWYGRVLVERVEGFASPGQWARAYDEINEFERDLVDWGAILVKFWVDISPEGQLQRFRDRQNDPAKQWKITDEDWRNRDKYPQYRAAIEDMFRLTSTEHAPWTLLESDDKLYARVKALEIIIEALEARLRR